jgi:hypothetical protein
LKILHSVQIIMLSGAKHLFSLIQFAGINPTLIRDYVNGFKRPSPKRVREIQDAINALGEIYSKTDFF